MLTRFIQWQQITITEMSESMAGMVIQATGRTEFKDVLRLTDSVSTLAHWPHLCCKTCLAMGEVWENFICLRGLLVHLEVSASSSNGISFPVPLGGPSSNAMSRTALPTTG